MENLEKFPTERPDTLGELLHDEGERQARAWLLREVSRASQLRGGANFDDTKISGVSEMGEAAGRYNTRTDKMELREDEVSPGRVETHGRVAHILVHEDIHRDGCHLEGVTELLASGLTGRPPVSAYRDRVDAARQLQHVIGEEALKEGAEKGDEAKVFYLQRYVEERAQRALDENQIEAIVDEGEELLRRAS